MARATTLTRDWHREQVKAAIRMKGITLTELATNHGYEASAVRKTLSRPWPVVEKIIADLLGMRPQDIWPSRYHADGKQKLSPSHP